MHRLVRLSKRLVLLVAGLIIGALGMRAWMSQSGPPLEPWHTFVPEELSASAMDHASWGEYALAEKHLFEEVAKEISERLGPEDRTAFNRYYSESVVNPARFPVDWNRTFVLEPEGTPAGVVVMLHGLTDSPYSLRHIGECYRTHGFVVLGLRLPGHGTVPAALTHVVWEDWMAAVRLAMREAARRAGDRPLHIVGYSNGGALALKYALDALEDSSLRRPDRIVLISPMIGVPPSARFAGAAGWPAVLPSFAKAAWLTIAPEYNPFKYNSFPVNAGRQSYRLTTALQAEVVREASEGRLAKLAPVLTFQSVVDATVVTAAVVSALYAYLPANGSELVLFDVNRQMDVGPLLRPEARVAATALLPPAPRKYRVAVITNADENGHDVVARVTEAGAVQEEARDLGVAYPPQVFSMSHVALPFPLSDGLYGLEPDLSEQFGVHLGTLGVRGERDVLDVDMNALMRITSNPFFPYLIERIESSFGQP